MTVGELLRRRCRTVMAFMYAGFALFVGGVIVPAALGPPPWGQWLMIVGLAGFGVAWLSGMGAYFVGFRCPDCRANLAQLFLYSGGFAGRYSVRFCPFCGCDLDATDAESRTPS